MQTGKIESAVLKFKNGYNCAQAVFSTYSGEYGISEEVASRLSSALGGGIGRQAYICGALTGAALVIGLHFGNTNPNDKESKEKAYLLIREHFTRFKSKHHFVECKNLLGCDISTPEGLKTAMDNNLFKLKCPEFVRASASILEDILKENS